MNVTYAGEKLKELNKLTLKVSDVLDYRIKTLDEMSSKKIKASQYYLELPWYKRLFTDSSIAYLDHRIDVLEEISELIEYQEEMIMISTLTKTASSIELTQDEIASMYNWIKTDE